jgi:hypothetical protein
MRVDSFSCSYLTPEKGGVEESIAAQEDSQEENSISVHRFLHHEDIYFSSLEGISLNQDSIVEIESLFSENKHMVPEIILKKEEITRANDGFSDHTRDYLTEEFNIESEFAFLTICILCYSHKTNISVTESAKALLVLNTQNINCKDCEFNLDSDESLTDILSGDDSVNDKDYVNDESEESEDSTSEDFSNSDFEGVTKKGNDVYDFQVQEDQSFKVFNPFCRAEKSVDGSVIINSTFKSSNKTAKGLFSEEISPIKKVTPIVKSSTCTHCGKTFSKSNNLKRHLISVHKIFLKGSTIFECPAVGCLFTTDNQSHFNRHKHKSSLSNLKIPPKPKCKICGNMFYNDSSLYRHMKRRHR